MADGDVGGRDGFPPPAPSGGGAPKAVGGDGRHEQNGRAPLHNIEAEQALLGALLLNNNVSDTIAFLEPGHFYEPVHSRIYEASLRRIKRGAVATPTTLRVELSADAGLTELGGPPYLSRLVGAATAVAAIKDYAEEIYRLATRRGLAIIGEQIAHSALDPSEQKDPIEQITSAEEQLYKLAETGRADGGFQSFAQALFQAVEVANKAYGRDGGLAGLSSGLMRMDDKLGGFHDSDLIILAGRPSMGKTALVTNIAFNIANAYRGSIGPDGVATDGGVVGFFSLEMSSEQLATRILSEQAEIASEKIRRGDLDEDEFRRFALCAQELEQAPLFIDDTPALRISTLAARARRLQRQHGLDLLIVDYLQLCRGSEKSGDNRVQEISEITQGLKAIAKDLKIPVIALSQLSRKVEEREDKRPQLSDLRESGSIEQDADVVMFVYREEYYLGRAEPRENTPEHVDWQARMNDVMGLAEVVIGKQRHGPIGTVKLAFDDRYTRFGDLAREGFGPEPR